MHIIVAMPISETIVMRLKAGWAKADTADANGVTFIIGSPFRHCRLLHRRPEDNRPLSDDPRRKGLSPRDSTQALSPFVAFAIRRAVIRPSPYSPSYNDAFGASVPTESRDLTGARSRPTPRACVNRRVPSRVRMYSSQLL